MFVSILVHRGRDGEPGFGRVETRSATSVTTCACDDELRVHSMHKQLAHEAGGSGGVSLVNGSGRFRGLLLEGHPKLRPAVCPGRSRENRGRIVGGWGSYRAARGARAPDSGSRSSREGPMDQVESFRGVPGSGSVEGDDIPDEVLDERINELVAGWAGSLFGGNSGQPRARPRTSSRGRISGRSTSCRGSRSRSWRF